MNAFSYAYVSMVWNPEPVFAPACCVSKYTTSNCLNVVNTVIITAGAIIALIAVPQVIKILNKARLSSAEDSTYGIVKSVENYITEFMLKNN